MRFEIGGYYLTQDIKDAIGLVEFSGEEYTLAENSGMRRMFKNEKWFNGEEIDFKDISWFPTFGSTEGRLYKIALQRDFDSEKDLKEAFERVKGIFIKDFGNFSENKGDKIYWDTQFGNILLTKASMFNYYCVNIFFTSNIIKDKNTVKLGNSRKSISSILRWVVNNFAEKFKNKTISH